MGGGGGSGSLNRGSEVLGGLGSTGFFWKNIPQADGRGKEKHAVGVSISKNLDVLEGVSSEYEDLWCQGSLLWA